MHVARKAVAGLDEARREVETVTQCIREGRPGRPVPGDTANPGAVRVAAGRLGVDRRSLADRIGTPDRPGSHFRRFGLQPDWAAGEKIAAERGEAGFEPVLAGFAVKRTTTRFDKGGGVSAQYVTQTKAPGPKGEIPAGHVVKGVSQLRDAEGRVAFEWVKTREGRDPLDLIETIKSAFEGYETQHEPIAAPAAASADLLTLLPLADWHIGAHSWGRETGNDWDLRIAEEVIGRAVENVIERSPASGFGVVLGGGDLMHADNQDNRTAKSGNQLDVDGRYDKVFEVAARMTVRTVDAMLRRHDRVLVRILKGNHDHHCSVAIAHHLKAWYRNEPRVEVDIDPGMFWYHRFGKVMLAATHGHETKLQDLPGVMAARRAEDWGLTRYRYAHGFHIHHKKLLGFEAGSVVAESHQAPVAQDAWHHGAGFLSGRSLQTITYHRSFGEVSRAREAILDGEVSQGGLAA